MHRHGAKARRACGFTLVELLVVVGIASVLISIILLSMGAVWTSARQVDTLARFNAIDAGLETYRNALGEDYPPSAGLYDLQASLPVVTVEVGPSTDAWFGPVFGKAAAKELLGGSAPEVVPMPVAGANLLTWALAGRDLMGTPGFVDLNGDGSWWDDTPGMYEYESGGQRRPRLPRHGPFIDLQGGDVVRLSDLSEDLGEPPAALPDEHFLADGFGNPILYYKAGVGARRMLGRPDGQRPAGVYHQSDNALYTGDGSSSAFGLDLGAGAGHRLNRFMLDGGTAVEVEVHPNPQLTDLTESRYDGTFARFIWDRKITVRNQPVNPDSYLLISAGADALWGTEDDITNFNK